MTIQNSGGNGVQEDDIHIMPNMVRWFDPSVLVKIIKPVIISGLFGNYADRRLMQAALDQRPHEEHFKYANIQNRLTRDAAGNSWIDFIADTGDGFGSTYSIAWLQSQPCLDVAGQELARGSLLLLGGDQVYPDATYPNYMNRFKKVFDWAYPDSGDKDDENHPLVYAIPGNHDWYDGLDLFLAFFCRAKAWKLGNWRTRQRRSYFAIQLNEKVWVWGIDIQLSENVDSPQAEYFREMASRMPVGSNIIMMTAVPGWYDTQHRGFNCLGYVEKIVHKANRNLKVPLVLSGDVHHYARYECKDIGTQFITSGGGGAFLHPTHTLRDSVRGSWGDALGGQRNITLAKLNNDDEANTGWACYPTKEKSIELLSGLKSSPFVNWKFGAILGVLYASMGLTSLMWNSLSDFFSIVKNPILLMWAIALLVIFVSYADKGDWLRNGKAFTKAPPINSSRGPWTTAKKHKHWLLGVPHAIAHVAVMTAISVSLYEILAIWLGFSFWTTAFNLTFVLFYTVFSSIAAGSIFALYLYLTCRFLGVHANDALSIQSLDQFRGFLRLCISPSEIKIYPIGIDRSVQKSDWMPNETGIGSLVVPRTNAPVHQLIEGPIVIPL